MQKIKLRRNVLVGLIFSVGFACTLVACNRINTTTTNVEDKGTKQYAQIEKVIETETTVNLDRITKTSSETEKNKELEKAIMSYFEISKEEIKANPTQYYYNYADTNGDGVEEIFALVMGPLTSGTGGSTLLHIFIENGVLLVKQSIPIVEYPIIISESQTNGIRDLIITNYDLSESGYLKLKNYNGEYQNPNDGEALESIDEVTGLMLMNNDVLQDREKGIALYLSEVD